MSMHLRARTSTSQLGLKDKGLPSLVSAHGLHVSGMYLSELGKLAKNYPSFPILSCALTKSQKVLVCHDAALMINKKNC